MRNALIIIGFSLFGVNAPGYSPAKSITFSGAPSTDITTTLLSTSTISTNGTNGNTHNSFGGNLTNLINWGFDALTGTTAKTAFKGGITFDLNNRLYKPVTSVTKLSVQLMAVADGKTSASLDGLVVVFDNKFSDAIGDEDSYKFGNPDENLAINRKGVLLSMEGRSRVTANDTVPLKIWQFRQKQYSLKLTAANFEPFVTAFVKDAYLNKETPVDLASVTGVPFTITADPASIAANRFTVIFKKTAAPKPVSIINEKAYSKGGGIGVEWTAEPEANVLNYSIEKAVNETIFSPVAVITAKGNRGLSQNYSWYDEKAEAGDNLYRIKLTYNLGEVKYSEVVKVNVVKKKSGIVIFPNPVTGKVIGLQLNSLEKGDYYTTLYSKLGQNVYTGMVKHAGGTGSYRIAIGAQLSRGIYTLHIVNGRQIVNTKVVIE